MIRTIIATAVATIAIVGAATDRAQANTWDDRAYFTFTAPVAVPGATLPPGDYMFRLADPDSGRKTVQVLSADGQTVHALFFVTNADQRASRTEETQLSLGEAPSGIAPSIVTWWHPSDLGGRTFLYAPGEASWNRKPVTSPSN